LTEQIDVKLLQEYESLRKREIDLMTELLDVLPRITNYDEDRVGQVRDAMFHADHPLLMMFVGAFNAGKSSLINALLGNDSVLRVGSTPTTDRISILRYGETAQMGLSVGAVDTIYHPSSFLSKVSFVDTPGLESIFKEHEETTRKFLHRADVVLFVMLSTQAMTQSNLETLQLFKEYGKKVILVINQADLLEEEDRKKVHDYVREQSKTKLGFVPDVWMVSAKIGQSAWQDDGTKNHELWRESGLSTIESYIATHLSDASRLRQKLQTPLRIAQSAHNLALDTLKNNQSAFDQHRMVVDNVERQLESQRQDLAKTARQTANDIEAKFEDTILRAKTALADLFQFTNALRALGWGILEMTFVARFIRGAKKPTYVLEAFTTHKVFEPLDELFTVVNKLPSRFEGQDQKDLADLMLYGRKEVSSFPKELHDKLIGSIQVPTSYNRTFLSDLRKPLEDVVEKIKTQETQHLNDQRQNALVILAVWQLVVIILLIALFSVFGAVSASSDAPVAWIALGVLLLMSLMGFVAMPLRGRFLHRQYAKRLTEIQTVYTASLLKATDTHINYALELRREVVSPIVRLIEAQSSLQNKQMTQLKNAEQTLTKLEDDLNDLGKRNILGIKL